MQALEIEYDLSFFDTDPCEPIPGGTMSIWPFLHKYPFRLRDMARINVYYLGAAAEILMNHIIIKFTHYHATDK